MRSKKALKNTIAGLMYELVAAACGFVLPKLIMSGFGSDYNGVTSSITQFLACITLIKMSVSGVTRAALYKPLAENDSRGISVIIKTTQNYLRKIAFMFAVGVVAFAAIYPIFVRNDFEWLFTFSLVIIIASSTFVQYYFGITYQILLIADQKQVVLYVTQIVTTIANTVIAAILIKCGCSIHVVKLGSAFAFSINPLILNTYAKRHYHLDFKVETDNHSISQRWDALGHALATFVHNNTDIVVLTIFSTVYEVSVYTVYYMVCNGIKKLLTTFTSSVGSAFGNMLAKNESENIQKNMDIFEFVTFSCTTVLFTITGIMILPFVHVYTRNITDVEYIRPVFSVLMVVGTAFFCLRIPYQAIVEAAGHYRQTRNGAIFEAVANIVISVLTVVKYGLIGVAVGTVFATVFRTLQYVFYLRKNIINRSVWLFFKQLATCSICVAATYLVCNAIGIICAESYYQFTVHSVVCGIVSGVFVAASAMLFYRKTCFAFIRMFLRSIKKKNRKKAAA